MATVWTYVGSFLRSIGQIFIVVKPKYWKMILPSGHTTFTANLPTYLGRGTNCSSGKSNHIRSKISVGDHLFLNAAWVDDDGDNDSANCQKLFYFFLFFKPAISGLFFFYFRLFNTIQLTVDNKCSIKFCRCLESNRGPLIPEATALPTEPQPLPKKLLLFVWGSNNNTGQCKQCFYASISTTLKEYNTSCCYLLKRIKSFSEESFLKWN